MGEEQAQIGGVTYQDLSGGLNTDRFTTEIEDRDAVSCQNVFYYDGRLRKMHGWDRVNTTINGANNLDPVTGIHDYQLRDTSRNLIVTLSDSIWSRNGNSWTDRTGALTVSNAQQQFVTFNDLVIGTNGTDNPWRWNGTDPAAIDLAGSPPIALYITAFAGRVFLGNATVGGVNLPARAYFSELDDPSTWDTTDNFLEFETDDGQAITGIKPLKDVLVVYKSDSIGLLSGAGFSSWDVKRDYIKGVGCTSGYTIASSRLFLNNKMTEVHIFLGEDGIYAFDGSQIYRLSDKIKEHLKAQNTARFPNATGVFYTPLDQYYLFFSGLGSSENNRGLIYDTRRNGWWPITGIRANAAAIVEDETTDENQLLIGDYLSTVWQMNETSFRTEDNSELLTNGSMEVDANWLDFGTPTTEERSALQAFNGTFSRRVITDAVDEGTYQDVTTVVGNTYRITVVVRPTNGGNVRLTKRDTDGSNVVNGTSITAQDAWAITTINFTATATTSRIAVVSVTVAVSEFFADDASCRRTDIDAQWDSKWFSLGQDKDLKFLRELVIMAEQEGDVDLDVRVRYDLSTETGSLGQINLNGTGALYGTDVYGTGVYGGVEVTFDDAEVSESEFRFIQIRFRHQIGGQRFRIEKFIIDAINLGRRFVHNAA